MIVRASIIKLFVVTVLLFLVSCHGKESRRTTMNEPSRSLEEIKKDVYQRGDTQAYSELSIAYLNYPPEDFLFWALMMANKYDYSPAYLDVYYSLKHAFDPQADDTRLGDMDEKTNELALRYLKIAAERKVANAQEVWKRTQLSK